MQLTLSTLFLAGLVAGAAVIKPRKPQDDNDIEDVVQSLLDRLAASVASTQPGAVQTLIPTTLSLLPTVAVPTDTPQLLPLPVTSSLSDVPSALETLLPTGPLSVSLQVALPTLPITSILSGVPSALASLLPTGPLSVSLQVALPTVDLPTLSLALPTDTPQLPSLPITSILSGVPSALETLLPTGPLSLSLPPLSLSASVSLAVALPTTLATVPGTSLGQLPGQIKTALPSVTAPTTALPAATAAATQIAAEVLAEVAHLRATIAAIIAGYLRALGFRV